MSVVEFFALLLSQFGLAYIIGHSVISLPFRYMLAPPGEDPSSPPRGWRYTLASWLECPACFGFWSGGAMGVFVPLVFLGRAGMLDRFVFAGLLVAGSNFVLGRVTRLI